MGMADEATCSAGWLEKREVICLCSLGTSLHRLEMGESSPVVERLVIVCGRERAGSYGIRTRQVVMAYEQGRPRVSIVGLPEHVPVSDAPLISGSGLLISFSRQYSTILLIRSIRAARLQFVRDVAHFNQ